MKRIWVLRCWLLVAAVSLGAVLQASATHANPSGRIDQLVFSKLDELGIPPSEPCTDEVFLRRVYLDMIGTLPTAEEARAFLDSNNGKKRSELIEQLFERAEFADYWSLKWCDLLRVKAEFPSKLWPNAVQAYHRWVHTALDTNMPYDQFARELLTASGSNFRDPPVNFYRAMPSRDPQETARVVALTFMGTRTDGWKEQRRLGMAALFGSVGYKGTAEWKEEIVFYDPAASFLHPATKKPVAPRLPNGTAVKLQPGQDPREVFSDWLVGNEVFSRSIVNRIWYWLLGRGIVHEADDFNPHNPPQNPALLDFLADELVSSGYDLRHVYRIILNSKTYQLSSIHNEGNLADEANFSRYYVRRLGAEVLIDALCQITGTTETYSSAIPEPFTWIPENQRSILLADGSITSPFLDLYGRPPRDSGYESERNNTPSSAQKLHLLNSTHIQRKLSQNKALLGMKKGTLDPNTGKGKWNSPEKTLEGMYLTILSRYPTDRERHYALERWRNAKKQYDAKIDIIWALLNTKEFIYKH